MELTKILGLRCCMELTKILGLRCLVKRAPGCYCILHRIFLQANNADSEDVASELGLHRLHTPQKRVSGLEWVNILWPYRITTCA